MSRLPRALSRCHIMQRWNITHCFSRFLATKTLRSAFGFFHPCRLTPFTFLAWCPIHTHPSFDIPLSTKFRCHPTIPCDIPLSQIELARCWYQLPSKILPNDWSCEWLEFQRISWFVPDWEYERTYDMSPLDMVLNTVYGVSYPIKGVMYCRVAWREPGKELDYLRPPPGNHERVVLQDALGDYYYHYEFSQGGDEFVGKFRAPHGTAVENFVKNYFKGGVNGVDMDQVLPKYGKHYDDALAEQGELAALRDQAEAQSRCACTSKF